MKQNLHFTEAALHLLLTLARTQQVGDCLGWKRHPARAEWFPCSLKPESDSDPFLSLEVFLGSI